MIDSFIILNRKPRFIIKLFILFMLLFTLILFYSFKKITYTSYLNKIAFVSIIDNNYYLRIDIPADEMDCVLNNQFIYIKDIGYWYCFYKMDDEVKSGNVLSIYLEIKNLKSSYKFNNYSVKVRIQKSRKTIYAYLKEVVYGFTK